MAATPDAIRQFHVENRKRKAIDEIFSETGPLVRRPKFRISLNFLRCFPDLCFEIESKPDRVALIEFHGCVEFCSRCAMDHYTLHEYFARNFEKTFSADSPVAFPLRISPDPRAALSRADVGRAACAEGLHAAWLDGCFRLLPVSGRRARARLVRDRAGLAWFRPERMVQRRLLVP